MPPSRVIATNRFLPIPVGTNDVVTGCSCSLNRFLNHRQQALQAFAALPRDLPLLHGQAWVEGGLWNRDSLLAHGSLALHKSDLPRFAQASGLPKNPSIPSEKDPSDL